MNIRIGQGYDVHALTDNRKLILGGVEIPYNMGLLGHSDADVLTHAIIDAICGAAGFGDIGVCFPDTNETYKNISSLELLAKINNMLESSKKTIVNIDATIVAQAPKLAPYKNQMVENISKTLNISKDNINIKATTEEGLGFTGTGQGMAAMAVCLINFL